MGKHIFVYEMRKYHSVAAVSEITGKEGGCGPGGGWGVGGGCLIYKKMW